MKKIINYLPFFVLFLLPLLFYPGAGTSGWRSSSDVHALLEFASSLLAITAGIMVLLHFFTSGRLFFLIISIGFVLIGTEEFVHAIFSFNRIWSETPPTFKLAISTTWLAGNFILLTSFFFAFIFRERKIVPEKKGLYAVVYNIIGLICAATVTLLIFNSPILPYFVQLGSITKKLIELSLGLLFFTAFVFYSNIYLKQKSHSPLLWSIIACIIFRVLVHIFVFDAQAFYDSHWDTAHLIVFLSYFFPIYGVWGETIKIHKSAQVHVIELGKEMTEHKKAEEALRESEERFRTLYENSTVGLYRTTPDGRIDLANPALVRMLGYSSFDDISTRNLEKNGFEPSYLRTQFVEIIEKDGEVKGLESAWMRKDGTIIFVRESARAIRDSEAKTLHYDGTVEDITERKRAERELRESEERYRRLVEGSPDAIAIHCEGKFIFVNSAGVKLIGAQGPQELIGRPILDVVHPDSRSKVIERTRQVAEGKEAPAFEEKFVKFDGSVINVEVVGIPCNYQGQIATQVVVRDITERKRAEEAVRKSEGMLQRVFDILPVGLWIADKDGKLLRGNPAGVKIWGAEPKVSLSQYGVFKARRLPSGEEVAPDDWALAHTIREKVTIVDELLEIDAFDGKKKTILNYTAPVLNAQGDVQGAIVVNQDITERKKAEEEICRKTNELQEKNDELTRFTYAVSHDLRSPLVTIQTFQGHLEQDLRSQDAARVEKDLGYIRNAADKMGRLLEELLRFSRVGRMMNPSEEAPLQAIVKEALDLVAGQITVRRVRVEVTEEPVLLYGDRIRLVEVFQNLVGNAVKFMGDQPAPRVEIGVEQAGEELVLHVRDNGIGIDPQLQPLLFGLFYKLDPGSEGEGIGLALVRQIVELHGGRIWVDSEGPGKGTTFRFTLAKTRRQPR